MQTPNAARAALAGDEFVFDIQGHFLEYRVNAATRQGRDFWTGFPQRGCGEQDPRVCFSINRFMEEVFLKSDTSMVVFSALPIAPDGSPMSAELMDEGRRVAEALCHDQRVLLHAQAVPDAVDVSKPGTKPGQSLASTRERASEENVAYEGRQPCPTLIRAPRANGSRPSPDGGALRAT